MLVFENIVICFSFDYINNENGLLKSTLPPYLGVVLYCVQNYFFVTGRARLIRTRLIRSST